MTEAEAPAPKKSSSLVPVGCLLMLVGPIGLHKLPS